MSLCELTKGTEVSQVALMVKDLSASSRDLGSITGWGRCAWVRNGNPLQYSCLENSIDRGAWRATVHGAAKSRTRLSDWADNKGNKRQPEVSQAGVVTSETRPAWWRQQLSSMTGIGRTGLQEVKPKSTSLAWWQEVWEWVLFADLKPRTILRLRTQEMEDSPRDSEGNAVVILAAP